MATNASVAYDLRQVADSSISERRLSRQEAKLLTRHRLLQAATSILAEEGYEALTTGHVARRAGVAQPTFYVHFRDTDDLLRAIAAEAIGELRAALRGAREGLQHGGDPVRLARETFRMSLSMITGKHRDLLRLFVAELHRPRSAIGESARALIAEVAADLVVDLERSGLVTGARAAHVSLVADAVVMLTMHFGLAHLEGSAPDLDALADLLAHTIISLLSEADGDGRRRRRTGRAHARS